MKKEFLFTLIFSIVLLILLLAIFIFPYTIKGEEFKDDFVTNVIDGDTFQYYNSETYSYEIVRLLCIDTPEKDEPGYEEAKSFLESLILYEQVNLTSSITDKDSYNRLLRYVYVDDLFINKEILDNNYGELLIIPPEECKEVINYSL